MSKVAATYTTWSTCDDCGYQGLVEFRCRSDEDYDDPDSLGVMMDCTCPACGLDESVLVLTEEYREMVFLAREARK